MLLESLREAAVKMIFSSQTEYRVGNVSISIPLYFLFMGNDELETVMLKTMD